MIDNKSLIKEAIKEFKEEEKEKYRNKKLHNTKLLMKNYNNLKDHIEEVSDDLDIEFEDLADEVWITSITRTKLRTMKMMAYIDSALKIVEKKFRTSCEEYKYKAFKLYYIDKKTNEEIQEILSCGKNSPKNWSDLVIEELSLLLWGIEALGM